MADRRGYTSLYQNIPVQPLSGYSDPSAFIRVREAVRGLEDQVTQIRGLVGNSVPGYVSSVGLTAPTIFSVTGSPVTDTGTIALSLVSQTARSVFAAPTGLAGTPSFRALEAADIQSGVFGITRGGTGLSSTPSNGQLLIGNGSGYTLATLTAGTGISITNGVGSIQIDNTLPGFLNPMTTLGDIIYGGAAGAATRLGGETTATRKFLRSVGVAGAATAPAWDTVTKTDVGLGNVEDVALSTWTGSSNLTTLGTVTNGTWSATSIAPAKGGTGLTTAPAQDVIVYGGGSLSFSTLAPPSSGTKVLTWTSAMGITWTDKPAGTVTAVTATSPVASSGGTTPDISLSAAYGDSQNPYGVKTANYVLAGPTTGAAAVPSFRALVAADIPSLSGTYLPLAGGTMSGAINMGTNDINNVGQVGIGINNPGVDLEFVNTNAAFNTTTPGTTKYALHFRAGTTGDQATGITWSGNSSASTNAHAGIYVQSSGSYGTKMYFATTNSFATGAQTAMTIDHNRYVGIGVAPSYLLHAEQTYTGAGGNVVTRLSSKVSPAATNANTQYGLFNTLTMNANATGSGRALYSAVQHRGASNAGVLSAGMFIIDNDDATTMGSTISDAVAVYAMTPSQNAMGGTITRSYGLYVQAQSGTNITTSYGVYQTGTSDINYFAGRVGIGTASPGTLLHLGAGTATVAPFRLTSGTNLTTAAQGSMEFDGSNLYFTPSSTRKTVAFTDSNITGTAANVTGTVATGNGGTGLTSIGSANQVLGVNSGVTALEYKTVTAGTGISITHAAGSITVTNTSPSSGGTVTSVTGTSPISVANGTTTPAISLGTVEIANGGTGLTTYTAGDLLYYSTGTALSKLAAVDKGILYGTASAPAYTAAADMAWDNTNKRLGIGKAAPATVLDIVHTVAGNAAVNMSNSSADPAANARYILNNSATSGGLLIRSSAHATEASDLVLYSTANNIRFYTGGNNRMSVGSTGNVAIDTDTLFVDAANNRVGIGTSGPVDRLSIVQYHNAATRAVIYNIDTGANASAALLLYTTANTGLELTSSGATNPNQLKLFSPLSGGVIMEASNASGFFAVATGGTYPSSERFRITSAGNVGIATTTANSTLSFGGNSARTVAMERHTTSNTAGNSLTIQSGGATSGATDKDSGDLILVPGVSTGTGRTDVRIQSRTRNTVSATTDNSLIDRIWVTSQTPITDNVFTTVLTVDVPPSGFTGGSIFYTITATGTFGAFTDFVSFSSMVTYGGSRNAAGTLAAGTNPVQEADAYSNIEGSTMTVTWQAIAGTGNNVLIQVKADSSMSAFTTGYPNIQYTIVHNGRSGIVRVP